MLVEKKNHKEFEFEGKVYCLHYDADGWGVYGIRRPEDDIITFINKIKDAKLKQAFKYAQKTYNIN